VSLCHAMYMSCTKPAGAHPAGAALMDVGPNGLAPACQRRAPLVEERAEGLRVGVFRNSTSLCADVEHHQIFHDTGPPVLLADADRASAAHQPYQVCTQPVAVQITPDQGFVISRCCASLLHHAAQQSQDSIRSNWALPTSSEFGTQIAAKFVPISMDHAQTNTLRLCGNPPRSCPMALTS
jgi:hypothetical protein